ncbi:YcaO-like family protein [Fusobacterium necrophorum]|uniref:YcaO-like family protein n=1 Tax=Fusobacterium necrophorum TaxID=859 RepID=UPI00254A8CCA|nr:YcaO-like family protein [Fusobacterium necrophorum]MDK4522224.1 YcaO-like family protein [Fusobacterium necrophorum]
MERVNVMKNLSIKNIGENKALVSSNGEFKVISCDINILLEFLQLAHGRTMNEIVEFFSDRFEESEVINFSKSLLEENIISFKPKNNMKEISKKVIVLFKGNLYSQLKKEMCNNIKIDREIEISQYNNTKLEADVIIVILDGISYGEMIDLNRELYKNKKPYLFVYYNGEGVVCGPFVIPGKTACYECLLTHRIKKLENNANNKIEIDMFRELVLSKMLESDSFNKLFYSNITRIIQHELSKIDNEGASFNFINSDRIYNDNFLDFKFERTFSPISSCECCHAHNSNYVQYKNIDINNMLLNSIFNGGNICYSVGGIRSISAIQTKKIVDAALEKSGLKIEIKLADDNPFNGIIPVFDSYLEKSHINKTSYLLYSQLSHGKGINEQQAYFSAAFEIFERISARYFGEKQIISAKYQDVRDRAINLKLMTDNIKNKNTDFDVFSEDMDVDWVIATSLSEETPILIPASMTFLTSTYFKGNFMPASSTGLAAGGTLKDAILQGIYEILEHDAWMIGQANTIKLPLVDIATSKNEDLKRKIDKIEQLGYKVVVRDYTNDIGIPVFRAWIVSLDDYTAYAFNGFGASYDPEIALERAITEAVQSANKKPMVKLKNFKKPSAGYMMDDPNSIYNLGYFIKKDIEMSPQENIISLGKYKKPPLNCVDEILKYTLQKLKSIDSNVDIIYYDLTRESLGIPVVRVVITNPIQMLASPLTIVSPRMYSFQKNMGYSDVKPRYEDFYMGIYPH